MATQFIQLKKYIRFPWAKNKIHVRVNIYRGWIPGTNSSLREVFYLPVKPRQNRFIRFEAFPEQTDWPQTVTLSPEEFYPRPLRSRYQPVSIRNIFTARPEAQKNKIFENCGFAKCTSVLGHSILHII